MTEISVEKKEKTNEEIELEEVEHQSKEMWLTNQFVNRPFIVILVTIVIACICSGISIAIDGFKMADPHDREYLIWSNERVEDFDLFILMRKAFLKSQLHTTIPERSQYVEDWNTNLVMKCDECDDKNFNVLTAEYVKLLWKAEQEFRKQTWYKKFCLASVTSSECHPTDSYISFTSMIPDIENLTDAKLQQILTNITTDETLFENWKGFFGNEFSSTNLKTQVLRAQFKMGGPLRLGGDDDYKDIYDDEQGQLKHFEKKLCSDIIDFYRDDFDTPGKLLIFPTSDALHDFETNQVVEEDFLLALGSITFVLVYVSFHLKSFYLGSQGMLNILYSFPISMTIFNGIFQIDYFSTLHVLVIFIILGISADNIFVFVDCWNQARSYDILKNDQKRRMAYTFRRASRAMLATSSTTCAAFLATGISDIMPISSFGFFAGILVPVNFILVITYFPASLIVFENYTKNMMQKCKKSSNQVEKVGRADQENPQSENNENEDEKKQKKETGGQKIERFFNDQVTTYTHKLRYPIMIIFAIWTGIGIWRTSKLPGMSEQVTFLPDDYDAQQAKDAILNDFTQAGNSDQGIKVYQFWGIQDLDKSNAGTWDPADMGEIEWDEEFDLSPPSNQQYFYDYCVNTKNNKIVQEGQLSCFMEPFKEFIEGKSKGFPLPQNEFLPELQLFVKTPTGLEYYNSNFIGIMDGKLKFVTIQMSSHGRAWAPYSELNPYFKEWDKFLDEENKKAPVGLNNSKQTALLHWVFMITEKALVDNAIQGVLISLAFAYVVLISTTHNIILAFYSTLTIGGIVVSVIGIIEMVGWELGVSESVAIVILIGLSVDYVVHLANHYVECVFTDRYRKTQVALRDLGISIVSGASTTLGSALFLFFATITLFNKFAVLIFTTIILSLLYAILLFSAVLHAFGPENGFGDLSKLFKKKKNDNGKEESENGQKGVEYKQGGYSPNAVHANVEQAKLTEKSDPSSDKKDNSVRIAVQDLEIQQPS